MRIMLIDEGDENKEAEAEVEVEAGSSVKAQGKKSELALFGANNS